MKKFLFISSCLLIVLFSCKKSSDDTGNNNNNNPVIVLGCMDKTSLTYNPLATNDDGNCVFPTQKQRALLIEYTSTCCHFCGEWGHDTFNNLIEKFKNDIIPISIHRELNTCTDIMEVESLYNSFNAERTSGLPSFCVNDNFSVSAYSNAISACIKNTSPILAVVLSSQKNGNTITVKTRTKFFTNSLKHEFFGEYSINVFVLENGIDGSPSAAASYVQSTDHVRSDYKHDYTLRGAGVVLDAYGTLLVNGTAANPIPENKIYPKDFTITVDPSWNLQNIKVCAVVWHKVTSSNHQFVNGYMEY